MLLNLSPVEHVQCTICTTKGTFTSMPELRGEVSITWRINSQNIIWAET